MVIIFDLPLWVGCAMTCEGMKQEKMRALQPLRIFLDFRAGGFLSIFILFEKLNLNPHP
jgi:hypothetical protein